MKVNELLLTSLFNSIYLTIYHYRTVLIIVLTLKMGLRNTHTWGAGKYE